MENLIDMNAELNYAEFRERLYKSAKAALLSVQANHADETFYAFGLYHSPLWEYIVPSANSEQVLTYRTSSFTGNVDVSNRWRPCDWAYHREGQEYFDSVNQWLTDSEIYDIDDDDLLDAADDEITGICLEVLSTLDKEQVFGHGEKRERVVINIMMGDQDDTWIDYARLLNSASTFNRWMHEVMYDGFNKRWQ